MALIKQESEDIKIEEVFSVKTEETEEQTGVKPGTEQTHKDTRGQTTKSKMTKPKQKTCPHCQALNNASCKTCKTCFASLTLGQRVKNKQKNIEESSWKSSTKKHRNAARVVDSARIAVKKLEVLGYKPILFISKERKKGFVAEVITSMGPFAVGPHQTIFKRMTSLYECFIKNYQRIQNHTSTAETVCQHQTSSLPPPSSSSFPPPSSSSIPPPSSPSIPPPSSSSIPPPSSSSIPPPSSPSIPPPSSSSIPPPSSSSIPPPSSSSIPPPSSSSIPPPSSPSIPPPSSSSLPPSSSSIPPPSSSSIPPPSSSSLPPSSSSIPPPSSSSIPPPSSSSLPPSLSSLPPSSSSSSFYTLPPPPSSFPTPPPPTPFSPTPPPTSSCITPAPSFYDSNLPSTNPCFHCQNSHAAPSKPKDPDNSSTLIARTGGKQRKWMYKQAECQVHPRLKTFPYDKIISRRMSNEGVREVNVRWKPCSGCGMKWTDTWEPYNLFFPE
ncbi:uncharacterized protein LOC143746582 isoform X3 [Siphateles boraxobius]|uniref:uncharacterized protein LOC143746582 isoform X3 n=1 Tax=Siphateles boraxobius TaxID=180520 RepID=UPI004063C7AB